MSFIFPVSFGVCFSVAASPFETETHLSDMLFAGGRIPSFKIHIEPEDIHALREEPRRYVRAQIQDGKHTYIDVAIRLKGGATFQPLDEKPSFTLNFDKFQGGQLFYGLDKIHLNNSLHDPSYLTEAVCSELFLAAGVPAARTTHARVSLNDGELGLYVLKEGIEKTFLRRHFKTSDGNLYDGGALQDITKSLERESGNGPENHSDLKALATVAKEPNIERRLSQLERQLDLERFLSFLALEVITWRQDGYAMNQNNYKIYHDPRIDKVVFIPHGMDQMCWKPNGPLYPQMSGLVARSFLEIPEARQRFERRVCELFTRVFRTDTLTNRVRELQARIRPVLVDIDAKVAEQQAQQTDMLCSRILKRADSLAKQLKIAQ